MSPHKYNAAQDPLIEVSKAMAKNLLATWKKANKNRRRKARVLSPGESLM